MIKTLSGLILLTNSDSINYIVTFCTAVNGLQNNMIFHILQHSTFYYRYLIIRFEFLKIFLDNACFN